MTNDQLAGILSTFVDLELAILTGSRAAGTARPDSDWGLAIQWSRRLDFVQQLAATERLRMTLAAKLQVPGQQIDLIDLPTARLTMRAVVAEEGFLSLAKTGCPGTVFCSALGESLKNQYCEQVYAA